jgi:hypothetical protein
LSAPDEKKNRLPMTWFAFSSPCACSYAFSDGIVPVPPTAQKMPSTLSVPGSCRAYDE